MIEKEFNILADNHISQDDIANTENITRYDVKNFVYDVFELLKEIFSKEKIVKSFDFNANAAYENLDNKNDVVIRYKILNRKYGQFDSSRPNSNSSLKNRKWFIVSKERDPKYPGYEVEVQKRIFDTIVEIGIWSKNYVDSSDVAFKVEDIMEDYESVFAKRGLDKLIYLERGEDQYKIVGGTTWYLSPLRYMLRTSQ